MSAPAVITRYLAAASAKNSRRWPTASPLTAQ